MAYRLKIDMAEVTRLTRQGKLKKAMAVLRGASSQAEDSTADDAAGTKPDRERAPDWQSRWSMPGGQFGAKTRPADGFARMPADWTSGMNALPEELRRVQPNPAARRSAPDPAMPKGASFTDHVHSGPGGQRDYKLYLPSTYAEAGPRLPLVVMLHGCTQSPDDFARGTRMNEIAEERGFLVVYPGQSQSANMQKCWNWYEAKDQQRGTGEPSLIAGITREVMGDYRVDPKRVFVAGLSAGGAAAAIMGQRYPEIYAAVGVHSGLACGAARDLNSAFSAMRGGAPIQSGKRIVPTIVFHGDRDTTVAPVNGDQVLQQAQAGMHSEAVETRGTTEGGVAYTRIVQREADGRERLESWRLHNVGHAWSGGDASGSYTLPGGPDASKEMIRFFLRVTG
ncbi:PHB depolymerase family esterase [Fulvimarina sp. MAC3]|uniref:extracellular catalytic domain type 1 short-chain-length polyhydroxyalkanoate depolymerase n=1 Tax=Fulvimarina sp. MAC3 TaxID=3148887 RepID=UPI0031FDB1C4